VANALRGAAVGATFAALAAAPLSAQPVRKDASPHAAPVELPAWLVPRGPSKPPPFDSVTPVRVPGSRVTFTERQAHDRFAAPDWFPDAHPAMPPIVARGRSPAVMACGYCHLPDGAGRPENASLAGLPVAYFVQQMAAFRDRTRESPWGAPAGSPFVNMRLAADSITPAEIDEAARYFASVKPRRRARVVEAANIPRVRAANGLYFLDPAGGTEPLGVRLLEVATDAERHELHDGGVEYVAYVPPRSVARGRVLATRGVPGVVASCTSCHGPQLRGVGLVPVIAGRSPSYLLRQLVSFAAGARTTPADSAMRRVAATLTLGDMIAAAAYAGSLRP
jgi:cytochrome c553